MKDVALLPVDFDDDIVSSAHNEDNVVSRRYRVLSNKPIREFSNDFADAFEVEDLRPSSKVKEAFYALVFQRNVPLRFNHMVKLKGITFRNFVYPLALEVVRIESFKAECLVAILPRPEGESLTKWLANRTDPVPEDEVKKIMYGVADVLDQLKRQGMAHGSIHPDRIYVTPFLDITVLESISSPCGFYQDSLYETVDRAMALPIAKGECAPSHDAYALGFLLLKLLEKEHPEFAKWRHHDDDKIIETKSALGSFHGYVTSTSVLAHYLDALIGLLTDITHDRWGVERVLEWCKGKGFNMIVLPTTKESSRPIVFHKKPFFNRRALALEMYNYWNEAREFIQEDHLVRWADSSLNDLILHSQIRNIMATMSPDSGTRMFDGIDKALAQILVILDPSAPIRIPGFAFHVIGLDMLFAYAYSQQHRETLQSLNIVLAAELIHFWVDNAKINSVAPKGLEQMVEKINSRVLVRMTQVGLGFGLERALYDLNPYMVCQSKELLHVYPKNLAQTLKALDDLCEGGTEQNEMTIHFTDKHLCAYIASHIRLQHEVSIRGLRKYLTEDELQLVNALGMFVMAQRHGGSKRLKGIARVMQMHLKKFVGRVHSKSIREDVESELDKVSRAGNLGAILKTAATPDYLAKDSIGFREAKKKYASLEDRKKMLRNDVHIVSSGYRYGLQLSVLLAYLLCALEVLYLVAKQM